MAPPKRKRRSQIFSRKTDRSRSRKKPSRKTSKKKSRKTSTKKSRKSACYQIQNENRCMSSRDQKNDPCYWSILAGSNKCIVHGYYGYQGRGKSDANYYPNQKDMMTFFENNINQLLYLAKKDNDQQLVRKLEELKKKKKVMERASRSVL